ncbi:MAG: phosphodiesterase [Gemmatimonadales bacterium]|nr:phosphodiesterase [Gemmatimonadales bacterium]
MKRFLLAQVTDLHIKAQGRLSYRVVDTAGCLARCVGHILDLPQKPDAALFTGDLTDFGRPEEYDQLSRLIAPLGIPFYLMPGNHDERDGLRRAFPSHGYLRQRGDTIDYVIDDWPLRLVALDTVVPMRSGGCLRPHQLEWLDAVLSAAPARPTLLALHHPPFSTGIGHMDDIGLEDPAGLEAVVRRHPQVELVTCGHLHRPIQRRFGGTIASTCPSPAHQVTLDLDDRAPSRFTMEPPGFQLHLWRDGLGVVTHTAAIGHFDGPYPFYEGGVLID